MIISGRFLNIHEGHTAYIVGKGPHLDKLEEIRDKLDSPGVIVMALNEAIHKVESLNLTNPTYVIQQDSELTSECVPQHSVHFMNSFQHDKSSSVKKHVKNSSWNPSASLYSFDERELSAVAALKIAALMGIKKVVLVAFDALSSIPDFRYAEAIGKDSGAVADAARHQPNGFWMIQVAKSTMDEVKVEFPGMKS